MLKSLALGALAVTILAAAPAAAGDEPPRRLVVNGTGEAKARPDMAVISAGVVVQADTASAALADNTRAMTAVLDQLRAAGLPAEDVQTSQFTVMPVYETPRPGAETTEPRIVGYQVSNQATARVRDLDRLGGILDALVSAGANSVNGPAFDLADPKQLLGEARDAAVADALAKARRYAAAAGVELGEILSIEEGGFYRAATPDDAGRGDGGRRPDRARPDRAVRERHDHLRDQMSRAMSGHGPSVGCRPVHAAPDGHGPSAAADVGSAGVAAPSEAQSWFSSAWRRAWYSLWVM